MSDNGMAFYVATYGLNQLCQCHRPTALAPILRMSYDTSTQSFNAVDQIRPEPAFLPYSDFAAADKYLFERARSEDHRYISCCGRIRHLSKVSRSGVQQADEFKYAGRWCRLCASRRSHFISATSGSG